MTTAAGFVAAGGPLSEQASVAACCLVGTALCSSSAAAWNQIFELFFLFLQQFPNIN